MGHKDISDSFMDPNIKKMIVDIGTESDEFLDKMYEYTKIKCIGLNLKDDQGHSYG
jgi:hypothetical protein